MSSILLPERFSTGNFASWLWDAANKLVKLPAFLQGLDASYFDSFTADAKSTYAKFQFDEQTLRPGEDPALFQSRLKELLERAEPDLSDTAKDALLRCQFIKGLPQNIRLRLLESNATPNLAEMLFFATLQGATW